MNQNTVTIANKSFNIPVMVRTSRTCFDSVDDYATHLNCSLRTYPSFDDLLDRYPRLWSIAATVPGLRPALLAEMAHCVTSAGMNQLLSVIDGDTGAHESIPQR